MTNRMDVFARPSRFSPRSSGSTLADCGSAIKVLAAKDSPSYINSDT